jgi:hypothetical protein
LIIVFICACVRGAYVVFVSVMKSSWSIHDFPPEDDGEVPIVVPAPEEPVVQRKLTAAERFELIRHRKNRKGKGSRRRKGEKHWATKGKPPLYQG